MCIVPSGSSQAAQALPALPPMPAPAPTSVDPAVVNNANAMKQRAAASQGYAGTIVNPGGGAGVMTPAFTTGSPGYKALTGQ